MCYIYYLIGVDQLTGYTGKSGQEAFLHCFFFSAQSLTTVGYGRIAPVGIAASWVASIESMIGLLIFALATGLLYGKFSRPKARIIHSKNALISGYKKENLVWGARFILNFQESPDGATIHYVNMINDYEPVGLPDYRVAAGARVYLIR
ncbi:MAG: two pore domain potassium channel family protein [Chitinophagales bacterium]|nr:two pore domain potassium channel family protein [Chitinophagales bacterium]